MRVDLCVLFAGLDLNAFAPLFLETLYRNCDVSNLCVHVVEKGRFESEYNGTEEWMKNLFMENYIPGVGDNVHNYLLKKKEESLVPFTIHDAHDASMFFNKRTPSEPEYGLGSDYAETLNWAIDNCGQNKWIIFCHSDMVFIKDIITPFIERMGDWTAGMFGIYGHFIAVNREAYHKINGNFNIISNFRAVPFSAAGFDYIIRHAADPRCPDVPESKTIYGWDTFQLLELMMIANGWVCDVEERHDLKDYVHHMASGHGYLGSKEAVDNRQGIISAWLNTYKVKRV